VLVEGAVDQRVRDLTLPLFLSTSSICKGFLFLFSRALRLSARAPPGTNTRGLRGSDPSSAPQPPPDHRGLMTVQSAIEDVTFAPDDLFPICAPLGLLPPRALCPALAAAALCEPRGGSDHGNGG
jgi:hypothetical protein